MKDGTVVHADSRRSEAAAAPAPRATAPAKRPRYETFDEFYRAQYRLVVGYLLLKANASFHAAEDATQEAMVYASRRWAEIQKNPASWVRTVAFRSYVRTHQREEERRVRELDSHDTTSTESMVDHAEHAEQQRQVVEMIKRLPREQRQALQLFVFADLSPAEIAQELGKTPATVRSNLRHARKNLAALLASTDGLTQPQVDSRED